MRHVTVTKQVTASADKIWEIIRKGDAINEWIPFIASCSLMGNGVGAKRTCVTADGKTLQETIMTVDDMKREFIYRIDKQEMMPITNIVNKLQVSSGMDTTIKWTAEFEIMDESMFSAVEQGLKDLFGMGIQGLEAAANKTM